jgi:hypothetical protein
LAPGQSIFEIEKTEKSMPNPSVVKVLQAVGFMFLLSIGFELTCGMRVGRPALIDSMQADGIVVKC